MRLLVTGGCGFVGSNFIRYILNHYDAEFITNVDPGIKSSRHFVHSNIAGTNFLLETARSHGVKRFVQVSTDEVYGSAEEEEFTEAHTSGW